VPTIAKQDRTSRGGNMTASAGRWFILILLSAVTLVYFNSFGGVFLFDDVRRDELTYIYLAAHEEGFKLRI